MTDDLLLAIVVEGIATDRIPLYTLEDVAALYEWLLMITGAPRTASLS